MRYISTKLKRAVFEIPLFFLFSFRKFSRINATYFPLSLSAFPNVTTLLFIFYLIQRKKCSIIQLRRIELYERILSVKHTPSAFPLATIIPTWSFAQKKGKKSNSFDVDYYEKIYIFLLSFAAAATLTLLRQ